MRRIATSIIGIALVAFYLACAADAPAPTQNGGGAHPTPTSTALQVRLFTSNANPVAGSCSLIQAIVSLNGVNVPDGTGVAFSTDNGFFEQNSNVFVSVTTQNGAAVTAVCNANPGLSNVKATATVGGQTGGGTIAISFQPGTQAAPFFTSCSPSSGPNTGGTSLTINGGRFTGSASTTRVTFTAAGITREALVTAVSATGITVTTPAFPEAVAPTVPVTITVTMGSTVLTVPNCFTYGTVGSGTPAITAVLPSSGSNEGNTRVFIVGSGFVAPLQVFFGTVEAQVVSVSFNQIVALSPPATGAGAANLNQRVDVNVLETNSGVRSTATTGDLFQYTTKMIITSINNGTQEIGFPFSPVTIFGQGFQAPVAVTLALIPATVISVSATEIIVQPSTPVTTGCTFPPGPVHVVNINTGDFADGPTFNYLITAPVIRGVSPSIGGPGTIINISGVGLSLVTTVTIGGRSVAATFDATSQTISFAAPDFSNGTPPKCVPPATSGLAPVGTPLDIVLKTVTGCTATASGAFQPEAGCVVGP